MSHNSLLDSFKQNLNLLNVAKNVKTILPQWLRKRLQEKNLKNTKERIPVCVGVVVNDGTGEKPKHRKRKKTIFVCAWNHPPRQDLYLPCCPSSTSLRSPLYRKAPICKWPRECLQQAAHDVSQNGAAKNNETQQIYGTTTGRRMARWSETRRKEKAKTWSGCNTSRLASFKIQSIFFLLIFAGLCGSVRLCAGALFQLISKWRNWSAVIRINHPVVLVAPHMCEKTTSFSYFSNFLLLRIRLCGAK